MGHRNLYDLVWCNSGLALLFHMLHINNISKWLYWSNSNLFDWHVYIGIIQITLTLFVNVVSHKGPGLVKYSRLLPVITLTVTGISRFMSLLPTVITLACDWNIRKVSVFTQCNDTNLWPTYLGLHMFLRTVMTLTCNWHTRVNIPYIYCDDTNAYL